MRILFLFFLIVPVLEMWLLITIGQMIGALPTIGLVLLTAVIGVNLLRAQGLSTLTRAQERMASGAIPAQELIEGMALAVGGALLLTPGFATDAFGFACLIPASRKWLASKALSGLLANGHMVDGMSGQSTDNYNENSGPVIIEGEYQDASDETPALTPENNFTDRS